MDGFGSFRVSSFSYSITHQRWVCPNLLDQHACPIFTGAIRQQLSLNELEAVVTEIEKEKEVEQQRLRDRRAATAASQAAMGRRTGDEL